MASQVGKKILPTSNDSNCPSNQLLMEIAQASNSQIQLQEILEILDKRINDKGKNWRHVFKALSLLEYLLYNGSEYVISYAHDNIYIIRTLKEFQYIDDRGRDYGANIRQKSREIYELLSNESKLIEMRISKNNRYDNIYSYGFDSDDGASTTNERTNYDTNLQIAIELSEKEAQIEKLKREANKKNENLIETDKNEEPTTTPGNLLSFDEIPVTNNPFSFDNNFTNTAANEYLRQQQMQQQQQEQLRQQMFQQQMFQQQQQQQQEQLRQQMLQQQMLQQQMQQEKMRQEQLRQEQLRQQQQQQQQQQNSESMFGSSFDGGAPAKNFIHEVIINNKNN
ncbi:ENTH-domain-containing protein [Neocallimastix sp. 'constans']